MSQYDFSKANCDEWRNTPNRNPITKRKIRPEAEFGVYKELERQCDPKEKSKTQVKERTEATRRTLSHSSRLNSPRSPSLFVSPYSRSNDSNNAKNNTKNNNNNDHKGFHLVAQITIIRDPIINILQDVNLCRQK